MTKKQKLELTWVGKENRPRLEPRILLEEPEKSYHAKHRVSDDDIFDNRLIFGDNLLALKALEQEFAGKVKCVFIDPPYNTGSAFEHYDDGLEHSIWLGLMRDRMEALRQLLSEDGSIWVALDDNEAHYFKVVGDEVFGRRNFVATVIWEKKYSPGNNEKGISATHDYIFCWAKDKSKWKWNLLSRTDKQDKLYKNPDRDPRGPWMSDNLTRAEFRERDFYQISTPSGKQVFPASGRSWSRPPEEIERLRQDGRLWFGPKGDSGPRLKRFLSEVQQGTVSRTIWTRGEVGDNEEAKREAKSLAEPTFPTPKPERLAQRVIEIATTRGDLVLDSFAGSGTTGAVAQKMGRRWIMVELGEHAHTHIIPRLKKVIDGEDKGGVTEASDWQGGGGFRYFKLAPSLLEVDKWGREVISKAYNAEMLAEALCKIEGFTYAPSDSVYWQQGTSTERDFIYVTTQTLSPEQLSSLSEEVGEGRTLLVLCAAFRGNTSAWPNLTVKKIPNHIATRCEWGHDDYSLNVENLPKVPPAPKPDAAKRASPAANQRSLFDSTGDDQ
ncbi:site-specific DNA-methyltransferase [Rhodomicrobium vannielii ATCC 17100]|uniref:site-specific DNA-methyltransferase n=1 Tax=Rhodomicrobium vannielii TaxID=1069 RepID=UPI00191A2C22|nr:site-specific DNA-methyltransferase [Rhodomicrobium vannielii]MBJ7533402.1 site-specific DNA-methyltransferase [Rhodomicrobium vannielii ATCC 17100]